MGIAQVVVRLNVPDIALHMQAIRKDRPGLIGGMFLREIGRRLDQQLLFCADIIDTLEQDGWKIRYFAHACHAQHPDISERRDVMFRLRAIGIDPKKVQVVYTWDNWVKDQYLSGQEIMEALGFKS